MPGGGSAGGGDLVLPDARYFAVGHGTRPAGPERPEDTILVVRIADVQRFVQKIPSESMPQNGGAAGRSWRE